MLINRRPGALLCIVGLILGLFGPASAQSTSSDHNSPPSKSTFVPSRDYMWPTEASPYASSSFGETRAGHFHAALDIKTWGRSGYKVVATRPGRLFRIGIGAHGYGHVVYLQHADSSYSVYAHLLKFAPRIRHLVDSLRMQNYSFEIDTVLADAGIQFDQGDVIGYSGASGIGPPHLHFELRTPSNKPFNPLLTNITIQDHRAPQLSSLAIEPLSADASINGEKAIETRRPSRKNGLYDFGTINVEGTVGLAVDAFDQADKVSNVYAVYQIKLINHGQTLFKTQVDSFSYQRTDQMHLDRVFALLKNTGRGYQRLYRADGNNLPFYSHTCHSGRINLPPGRHQLTIEARDFNGNTSRGKVVLNVHQTGPKKSQQQHASLGFLPIREEQQVRSIPAKVLNSWYWSDNWMAPTGKDGSDTLWVEPQGMLFNAAYPVKIPADTAIRLDYTYATSLRTGDGRAVTMQRLYPGRQTTIYDEQGIASATFSRSALYDTLSIGLASYDDPQSPGLAKLFLFPATYPIRDTSQLSYHLPKDLADEHGWGLYHIKARNGRADYIPTRKKGDRLNGTISAMGTYVVRIDTTAPEMGKPRWRRRADGEQRLSIYVKDQLSGLDYNSAVMRINGRRGIAEYDAEHHRLSYYRPDFSPEAGQTLTLEVEVSDQAGNRRVEKFKVPAQ